MGRSIEIKDADNSRIQDRLILFAEIYRNIEHDIYDLENLQYTSFCLMHFFSLSKIYKIISGNKDHRENRQYPKMYTIQ